MSIRRFASLMLTLLCLAYLAPAWSENASGVVYNDANRNGVRDASEHGLPGVLVSNGVDVMATDKSGHYTLPVTDDTIVFVIKPRGWMTPVGPGNDVSRFYYIHKPNGSPKMKYAGVAPTGPLPASIDFSLHRQRERDTFRVVCFGDTQTRNKQEVQFLAHDFLDELNGTDAAFGITLGDNVFNDLTVFEPLVETMSSVAIPWRYVPGNHDHNHDGPTVESTDDTFERVFGPSYYSFNYAQVHFIVMNNIRTEAFKEDYHCGLGERQFTFVKNDLAHVSPKQLVVLLMHIPIAGQDERDALFALLKDYPNTFSLSAHTHSQRHEFLGKESGWLQEKPHHHLNHGTTCGSWWGGGFDELGIPMTPMADGGPNNYSFITFSGTKYSVEFRVPRRPAEYQMNVWTPERTASNHDGKASAIVNVFGGSARSRVEMNIDGMAEWKTMEQFTGKDPYYLEIIGRYDAFVSKIAKRQGITDFSKEFITSVRKDFAPVLPGLPAPHDTDHLWRSPLPTGLTPGAHTLTVRTADIFGHAYEVKRIFVVE